MDKIIFQRKKQLSELKHIISMQGLLNQYDRQNEYLNHQVQDLLIENQYLKKSHLLQQPNSLNNSLTKDNKFTLLNRKSSANFINFKDKQQKIDKGRKSRYQYLFDENQIKNVKNSIRDQIKNNTKKIITTIQPIQRPAINIIQKQKENEQIIVKNVNRNPLINSSLIKKDELKQKGLSNIKQQPKQKQKSKEKLAVESFSRVFQQKPKQTEIKGQKQISQQSKFTKLAYLQESDVLQQTFGHSRQIQTQKKQSHLQKELGSGIKVQDILNRSQTRIIPISNKQSYLSIQKSPIPSTSCIRNRKHSLQPSPKIHLNYQTPNRSFINSSTIIVSPFVLKTQQNISFKGKEGINILGGDKNIKLERNLSNNTKLESNLSSKSLLKRKFINIVSNRKIQSKNSIQQ